MTVDDRHWCEHCGDWFAVDHYDDLIVPDDDDSPCTGGGHKVGVEYGPIGRLLAIEAAAKELAAATDPEALDDGTLEPYSTAWYRRDWIAEAHGKLAGLLGDDA